MEMEITRSGPVRSGAPVSTRSTIIAAARKLLNREGAANISLESVAAETGIPPETVSVHFKDKADLLIGLAADDMSSLASAMREDTGSAEDDRPGPAPRIIEHVAKPDERVMARLERRMQMLERAFADVVERHETSSRARPIGPPENENDFASRELLEGFEMTEDQNGTELPPVTAVADAKPTEDHGPVEPVCFSAEEHDLPPVVAPPPIVAAKDAMTSDAELPPVRNEAKADPARTTTTSRDYLAAARRAASAAQPEMISKVRHQSIAPPASKSSTSRMRVLVYGCAAPMVILAASIMVLNRNTVTAEPASASAPQQQAASPAPITGPRPAVAAPAKPAVAPEAGPAVAPATPSQDAQPANGQPVEVLIQSAQLGDATAERDLGLRYLAGNGIDVNEAEAARWLMQSAYQGEAIAQYWLGTLYAGGKGVPVDGFQAKHWYEAAAKKGNVKAMHNLARTEFEGQGTDKDMPSAVLWFTKAAGLGLRASQYNLGTLYERGNGVSQNLVEAYKWYSVAASHGDKDAEMRLTILSGELKPDQIAQAKQLAAGFKPTMQDASAN